MSSNLDLLFEKFSNIETKLELKRNIYESVFTVIPFKLPFSKNSVNSFPN